MPTLSLPPRWAHRHWAETDSTMLRLREPGAEPTGCDFLLATADHQTAGRGQRGSHWEAEAGRNLLFGIRLHPTFVPVARQFCLSELQALAVADAVAQWALGVSIKWPNDIYVGHSKLGGMLLEHDCAGARIATTLTGVGLNVNQRQFRSDAPNPVSLCQLLGHELDRWALLEDIVARFDRDYDLLCRGGAAALHERYLARLYRRTGLHPWRDAEGDFMAEVADVAPDGRLTLSDAEGRLRSYAFKEVAHVLPQE